MELQPTRKMNVLFAAAEAEPFVKVGGLGDVAGALPPAIKAVDPAGVDIRLILPFHSAIKSSGLDIRKIDDFSFKANGKPIDCQLYVSQVGAVPVYLVDNEHVNHDSPVYRGDWELDGLKYATFSLAILEAVKFIHWQPDILHVNDWHTALAAYALKTAYSLDPFFAGVKSALSVHNLPFNGWGAQDAMMALGFRHSSDPDLPDWAKFTPLPMGISAADRVVAVSPNYAREILTADFGCGMEGYLSQHQDKLVGILNGIDTRLYDPATDKAIPHNYSVETLPDRDQNKLDLQRGFGFAENLDIPLLTIVSRLTHQKGIQFIFEAMRNLIDQSWQFVLLGTGDPGLEQDAISLAREYPRRTAAIVRYDEAIARMLYASGDIFLMPSLYEPCGLAQMVAMRYGNIPVATATGGLVDTINDASENHGNGTGFLFSEKTVHGLTGAIKRALEVYHDQTSWKRLQFNAMQTDFSWMKSAQEYVRVYQQLLHTPDREEQ